MAPAVIATAQLIVSLDPSIVNVALPHIQTALGFSGSNLEWVANACAAAFGSLMLLGGRACRAQADHYKRRESNMKFVAVSTNTKDVSPFIGGGLPAGGGAPDSRHHYQRMGESGLFWGGSGA